jgi:hypothetical protein
VLAAIPSQDAVLIGLCNQLVEARTEDCLLCQHDEYAPDFGPNNAHYERLRDDQDRLVDSISECKPPGSPAGFAALSRAALTLSDRNSGGEAVCANWGEELLTMLAEGLSAGFVWPPRPGSCSTAHWAPPTSPATIAEERAEREAHYAKVGAEIREKLEDARRIDELADMWAAARVVS